MVEDRRKGYTTNFPKPMSAGIANGKPPPYSQYHTNGYLPKAQQDQMFFAQGNMIPQNQNGEHLTEAFGRMNLHAPYAASDKFSRSVSNQSYDGGIQLNAGFPQAVVCNGQLMFTGNQHHPGMPLQNGNAMAQVPAMYPPNAAQYLNQPNFQYNGMLSAHSPLSSGWPRSRVPSDNVPSLVTPRRDSSSSHENDVPGTPFTQYNGYHDYSTGVALDRSPHSFYAAWSTPSSTQNGYKSQQHQASISPRLQLLVQQEPAIPRAIPAPYSPVKPLDRALENTNGVTNVYIRGLLPNTTDEMLFKLAERFGDIMSSKSIIDHTTGKCKGFGFVKYHNFKDAEDCIRGFHFMGYETSFARESFYSQLKKLSDEDNTNLYVSNLPKDMNEHELGAIFGPHKVCSSRILRDGAGNGRGVGFARFESRDVCEEVIKNYDKTNVSAPDGTQHTIQIRYADTQNQKALKQQTTAARQYRTAEYESQTETEPGTPWVNGSRYVSNASGPSLADNDFESYLTTTTANASGMLGARIGVRDRLSNISSQLGSSNVAPAINGNIASTTVPEPRIATVNNSTRAETTSAVNGEDVDLIDLTSDDEEQDLIDLLF